MIRTSLPEYISSSPIAQPANGAIHLSAAGSAGRHGDDRRVLHRAVLLERLRERGDGRVLLPDRDVDAEDVLALLVDDRVDRDRRLAGAAVADDQLALALADRDQRVDRADTGLQRLLDRLALDDARRGVLDRAIFLGRRSGPCRRPAAPSGLTTRPSSASPTGTDDDAAGAADLIAFLDVGVGAHDRRRRRCPLRG